MHIRYDTQKLGDGSTRRYVSVVHNVWDRANAAHKGRAKPVVFANLGREDRLDLTLVRSARDALDGYLRKRLAAEAAAGRPVPPELAASVAEAPRVEAIAREGREKASRMKLLCQVDLGLRPAIEAVWKSLRIEHALKRFAVEHRIEFEFERVVFGMVWNRLVDPKSKLACNEWLQKHAYFPEAEGWKVQVFYKALDILHAHAEELERALQGTLREQLDPSCLDLLLIDTTSSYFESDFDDVERAAIAEEWKAFYEDRGPEPLAPEPQVVNEPPMRMRGHSKDHRPDKPQIVVGTVCTRDGHPLCHVTYEGNRQDQRVTTELVERAKRVVPAGGRVVVVTDAGMAGGPNIELIDAMDGRPDRITAVPLRRSNFGREQVLARPGRYRSHSKKLHYEVRSVTFTADESPSGRPEIWVATRNKLDAQRVNRRLERNIAKVQAALAKNDSAEGHGRATCAVLTHQSLKKLVKKTKDRRRLVLDTARVKEERMLAGVRLLRSTLTELPAEEILDAYQALLGVEDNFRTLKTPLRMRPMYHRRAHRIEAHVTVCMLAVLVLREVERRTSMRFDAVRELFKPVRATLIEQGERRFWQRTECDDQVETVLEAVGAKRLPAVWGAHPVPRDDAAKEA